MPKPRRVSLCQHYANCITVPLSGTAPQTPRQAHVVDHRRIRQDGRQPGKADPAHWAYSYTQVRTPLLERSSSLVAHVQGEPACLGEEA